MLYSQKTPGETNALPVDEQELESQASPRNSQLQPQQPRQQQRPRRLSRIILSSIPKIFLASYFIFSVSIYCLLPHEAVKVFWFLYLTIGTFFVGAILLEAYDGLSIHALARKAVAKVAKSGWDDKARVPSVELIFEGDDRDDDRDLSALQEHLAYPREQLTITVLPEFGVDDEDLFHHILHTYRRRIVGQPEITAIFRRGETAHPHAVRHAVERLGREKNPVEIVQSRSVLAAQPGQSWWQRVYSSLAAFHHDAIYGLLDPGKSVTWGMSLTHGSAVYAKTTALQTVAEALVKSDATLEGPGLAFAAHATGTAIAYDLSVVTYRACPSTVLGCLRRHIHAAATATRAMPFLKLAVTNWREAKSNPEKPNHKPPPKRTIKQRFAILYSLLLTRVGSHAILQYFSLALALLILYPPDSAAEFSRLIFFPYTISIWLMVAGVVCMFATVAIMHRAASEFAPKGWWFPAILVWYLFMLVGQALLDVYAQAGVLLGNL